MITNCGVGITTDKPLPKRHAHDFYATDPGSITSVLDRFRHTPGTGRHYQYPRRVLDPGAGSGNWGKVAREMFPLSHITGCEIRDVPKPADYDHWLLGDFTTLYHGLFPAFNLIMGNPPFNQAEAFVRTGMPLLHEESHMVFLLRLAFLEGQARRDGLFAEFPPRFVWVHSKRPSFQENGKTNATAFATFVWQKGHIGKTEIGWLR